MLGGSISVESKVGEGTTFTIIRPFHRVAADETVQIKPVESKESLHGMKILLVEDNALNSEITEYLLAHEGCSVRTATNGQEAVQIFEQSRPFYFDAILMDVMMPVMDGYTATGKIRAMDRPDAGKVHIVAMTANAFDDDRRKAFECGMNGHIVKPINMKMIAMVFDQIF